MQSKTLFPSVMIITNVFFIFLSGKHKGPDTLFIYNKVLDIYRIRILNLYHYSANTDRVSSNLVHDKCDRLHSLLTDYYCQFYPGCLIFSPGTPAFFQQ